MKNQKGITLIALVITIIVLLILAAVSIAMLTGENGLLSRSKSGVAKNAIGGAKDEISLAYNTAFSEYLEKKYDDNVSTKPTFASLLATEIGKVTGDKLHGCTIDPAYTSGATSIVVKYNDGNQTYSCTGTISVTAGSESLKWGTIEGPST